MSSLFYFMLGGIFFYILLPILEDIVSVIGTKIEQYKAKCGVKIAEYNEQIAQIHKGKTTQNPIGFKHAPPLDKEE